MRTEGLTAQQAQKAMAQFLDWYAIKVRPVKHWATGTVTNPEPPSLSECRIRMHQVVSWIGYKNASRREVTILLSAARDYWTAEQMRRRLAGYCAIDAIDVLPPFPPDMPGYVS